MTKKEILVILIVAAMVFSTIKIKRHYFGYEEVLSRLSMADGGEAMIVLDWEGWLAEGYGVSLWYRPYPGSIWGVEVLEYSIKEKWEKASLRFDSLKGELVVQDERGRIWSYNPQTTARSYADSGFLFDPDWQPRLW